MKQGNTYLSFYIFVFCTLCILCSPTRSLSNNYTVTVKGFYFGYDGYGQRIFPLKGARVVLMDSDTDGSTLFDDEMGSSYINDDGSFSVTGTGGDPGSFSWSKPDVYIRVYFNNDKGVRLTNELDWDRYSETPQHDHDNFEGTLDIGTWITGAGVNPGEGTKPGVWIRAEEAYEEYKSIVGAVPPAGKYDVEYWSAIWAGTPWTNTNTTHWPIHFGTYAVRHEFGHSVRHAFDGDASHFSWDVTRFRYARNHSMCDNDCNQIGTDTHTMGLAFGFNEGWAEFWADERRSICGVPIKDECEGNIAFALLNLSNSNGAGKKGMTQILQAHPGQIHSLDDFMNFYAANYSVSRSALVSDVFKNKTVIPHNIAPVTFSVTANQKLAVQKNITEVRKYLSSMKEQLAAARIKAINIRICDSSDCYQNFQTLIRPIIISAEISIKNLELQRMTKSLTGVSIENYSAWLRKGTFDSLRSIEKQTYTKNVILIEGNAYKQIITSAKRLADHSEIAKLMMVDYSTKMNNFIAYTRKTKKLPSSSCSQFIFSEDISQIKRQ